MGENLRGRVAARAAGGAQTAPREASVTEIATREKPLVDLVREMEPEFAKAAPRGVEAIQIVRDVLTAISVNPKLKECQPITVLGGAMTFAQLGLRPNVGSLGHGWLIPFWDKSNRVMKAQVVVGYKGLADLVTRSGMASDLGAHAVHRNDQFRMAFVDGRRIVNHEPDWWGDRGDLLGWFAAGKVSGFDTYTFTEPWSVSQMEQHRDKFAMARKDGVVVGPWRDHFGSMAKKTTLLDLIKLLPKSTDVQRAVEADGSVRVDLTPDGIDRSEQVIDGEVVGDTSEPANGEQTAGGDA
jgi:recombination protein RecT